MLSALDAQLVSVRFIDISLIVSFVRSIASSLVSLFSFVCC